MRTTLDLDDAILEAARALAAHDKVSLGAAVSRLARRGLLNNGPARAVEGFPTFTPSPDAEPLTMGIVNTHRDD